MRKLIVLMFLFMLMVNSAALAQSVEVVGYGDDKEAATKDAMRAAVEQVVGTFLDSKTLVSQSVVVQDEIYSKAQGFVTNINVLEEGKSGDNYFVRARVDVNTNPDSQLQDRLQMIMLLGDPRIGVIVNYYNDMETYKREKYPIICESAINNKLASLGFTHVIAANIILQQKGLSRTETLSGNNLLPNTSIDYLVIGRLDINTGNIALPRYTEYSSEDNNNQYKTNLITSLAEVDIEVLKASTGEVVGSYRINAKSIKDTDNNAENAAIQQVGLLAAEKIKQVFSKTASNVGNNLQVIARVESYDVLLTLEDELKHTSGIRNAKIKSFSSGKGYIDIDTDANSQNVFRMLKFNSKLNLFMEEVTVNTLSISAR